MTDQESFKLSKSIAKAKLNHKICHLSIMDKDVALSAFDTFYDMGYNDGLVRGKTKDLDINVDKVKYRV